jgi:hypothetical protein
MKTPDYISIRDYLDHKGITYRVSNGELVASCVFGDCDRDSRENEGHLYFNPVTSQYHCKKCGVIGNIVTLAKHLGDPVASVTVKPKPKQPAKFGPELVDYCHGNLPVRIRRYLNNRGIPDELIDRYHLGYGYFRGQYWITIPVYSSDGKPLYLKLRQDPENGSDKTSWPGGAVSLYNGQIVTDQLERLVVCEGELDCLFATAKGISAVTSTHGAMNFKHEWLDGVRKGLPIYLCFDNDATGHKAAVKHAQALVKAGYTAVHIITLPDEVGDKGDLTDYFTALQGKQEDLFTTYSAPYPPRIDTSRFREMGFSDIAMVLDLTIVDDNVNKVIAFLAMLSAYTPDSQLNVSFNAPSSSGKTYITQEVAKLFPPENVMKLAKVTATAFYHEVGDYDPETNSHVVNFGKTVLVFLDQPNQDLMAALRTLLSHDDKKLDSKITDKSDSNGHRTKGVTFIGFPVVIYCTTGQLLDEQEATRFILLSPEINDGRLHRSVQMTLERLGSPATFAAAVENNPARKLLKQRIQAIQHTEIEEILIPEGMLEGIYKTFVGDRKLKPRDNRDIARLLSFAKIFALLNLWFRQRHGKVLVVAESDIREAFKVWEAIEKTQDLSIAPYVLGVFKDVILPLYKEKNTRCAFDSSVGLTRQQIVNGYSQVYGHAISETKLRQDILPPLEEAGLIYQESDPDNSRKKLVFIREQPTSEPDSGAK